MVFVSLEPWELVGVVFMQGTCSNFNTSCFDNLIIIIPVASSQVHNALGTVIIIVLLFCTFRNKKGSQQGGKRERM